jgi:N-methylhydantoinase A
VTDANIVLGRIDAEKPIGGELDRLDVEAARTAIGTHVGAPLGLETEDAAEAILKVANARMAGAIRLVSIERGHNPQNFSFMPFGGGGALHACALVDECELARALVPRFPGVTSALGCVIADMRQDFVQTINTTLAALDEAELGIMIQAHVDEGMALLDASGVQFGARDVQVELDMAYAGQTHTVAVPITVEMTDSQVVAPTIDAIRDAFENAYRAAFSRLLDGGVQRILNLRTSTIGRRPKFDLSSLAPDEANATSTPYGSRSVRMNGAWHDTALYDRLMLPVGTVIDGPAILTQPDTTILVEPGFQGRVDSFGNLILERRTVS